MVYSIIDWIYSRCFLYLKVFTESLFWFTVCRTWLVGSVQVLRYRSTWTRRQIYAYFFILSHGITVFPAPPLLSCLLMYRFRCLHSDTHMWLLCVVKVYYSIQYWPAFAYRDDVFRLGLLGDGMDTFSSGCKVNDFLPAEGKYIAEPQTGQTRKEGSSL